MKFASIRELSQNPSKLVDIEGPIIITKRGRPVRALVSMNEDELEDFILAEHLGLEENTKKALLASSRGKNISSQKLKGKFQKRLSH